MRFDLAESTCPPLRFEELADVAELATMSLGYGTSHGSPELRELIAADYGVEADQVLVTVGAIEAMFLLAQATCLPGDRVLLATPCFPPARVVPESLGASVDMVPLSFDDGFRLPLDRVADALTPRTRLVSLASPQNPSGIRLTDDELAVVVEVVRERAPEAVVLVDETYRAATFDDDPTPRSAAATSPAIVTCSSLSKGHRAPGLRLGWLTTTNSQLYEKLRDAKFYTTITCSSVDEFLATRVLRRQAEILAPRAKRLGQARAGLLDWAKDQPSTSSHRRAGRCAACGCRPTGSPTRRVAAFYGRLTELDTRVAPGSWFGAPDRIFRLGFGHLPANDFTTALDRLAHVLIAP